MKKPPICPTIHFAVHFQRLYLNIFFCATLNLAKFRFFALVSRLTSEKNDPVGYLNDAETLFNHVRWTSQIVQWSTRPNVTIVVD